MDVALVSRLPDERGGVAAALILDERWREEDDDVALGAGEEVDERVGDVSAFTGTLGDRAGREGDGEDRDTMAEVGAERVGEAGEEVELLFTWVDACSLSKD